MHWGGLVVLPQHRDCRLGVALGTVALVGAGSGVFARLLQYHGCFMRASGWDGPEAQHVMCRDAVKLCYEE